MCLASRDDPNALLYRLCIASRTQALVLFLLVLSHVGHQRTPIRSIVEVLRKVSLRREAEHIEKETGIRDVKIPSPNDPLTE